MSRFPALAFTALVVATVGAFFITQHLKVATPLIAGFPRPFPAAINPADGVTCPDPVTGKPVNHRQMTISFYLLHHSDSVDVWIADPTGRPVATLARGRFMPGGSHPVRSYFSWTGRNQAGALAPDGKYYVKVRLIHQGRTVTISDNTGPLPVTIKTTTPEPVVVSVQPRVVFRHRLAPVKIGYAGNETRAATVRIYALHRRRGPQLVKAFLTSGQGQSAIWDGRIRKLPAAPGRYLIGLEVTDAACNTGYFPPSLTSLSADVTRAEVTVRR